MQRFRGGFPATIDAKGRVKLPARLREQLEEGFGREVFVCSFFPHEVRVYPLTAWELPNRRRVSKFLDFAERRTDLFDVWKTTPDDQAVFADHAEFFAVLQKNADRFRPGDVLVVRRVRSEGRALHHNLIVLETDLLLGIPVLLAGNAARPRIQTFDGVMQINPRRYLQYRIRPQPAWFDAALLRAHAQGIRVP